MGREGGSDHTAIVHCLARPSQSPQYYIAALVSYRSYYPFSNILLIRNLFYIYFHL